jgi:hypothetical protein
MSPQAAEKLVEFFACDSRQQRGFRGVLFVAWPFRAANAG